MIKLTTGNILLSEAEALVNTVNTEGVMGKGIALQFKESFEENFKLYHQACKNNEVQIGKMFVTHTNKLDGAKYIINFPTKKHWRYPSKLEYIEKGLDNLKKVIIEKDIKSIAMPPLGCGNGGLDWAIVKKLIEDKLYDLQDVEILLFEPSGVAYEKPRRVLNKKTPKITPVRAMILSIMSRYSLLGYQLSFLESQKLVYFLQRFGEPLGLEFNKNMYGPFASKLSHVLYDLDGFYISGMKYKEVKKYDPLTVLEDKKSEIEYYVSAQCTDSQKQRLETVYNLIEGFEFPLGMELLSTVDYVMKYEVTDQSNLRAVHQKVIEWNDRKKHILIPYYINIAHKRLMEFSQALY